MSSTLRTWTATTIATGLATATILGCSAAAPPAAPQSQGDQAQQAALRASAQATSCATTACTPATCTVVTPSDPLITDWQDLGPGGIFVDNGSFSNPNPSWWTGFYGSPYIYPANSDCAVQQPAFPLSQTTDGSWHVTGTVGDWSGFGLWLGACTVDLSAYRGISFDISGNPGPSGTLDLFVPTGGDSTPETCRTNVGTCDAQTASCLTPWKKITIPATPGTPTTLLWSDFVGGSPLASPDPSQILQFMWAFDWVDWNGVKSNPYRVDVTVGRVELVP